MAQSVYPASLAKIGANQYNSQGNKQYNSQYDRQYDNLVKRS
jgi:hypothetical protein